MQLKAKKIKKHFKDIGITHLYHANSVKTACTFIEEGGLLSRGAVESKELIQSPQSSDSKGKRFNVWNDIFLDGCDLHTRLGRQNKYGPVLFKFSIDLLGYEEIPPIWVTKDNPIYWNVFGTSSDRYFQNIKEFKKLYKLGTYKYMITLRDTSRILPFEPFLEEIILDNPKVKLVKPDRSLGKEAVLALSTSIKKNEYIRKNVKISVRKCSNCYCHTNYLNEVKPRDLKEFSWLIDNLLRSDWFPTKTVTSPTTSKRNPHYTVDRTG